MIGVARRCVQRLEVTFGPVILSHTRFISSLLRIAAPISAAIALGLSGNGGLALGVALFVWIASFGVRQWELEQRSVHDDRIAATILTDRSNRRFVLYLRPFSTDAAMAENPAYNVYENQDEPKSLSFESIFKRGAQRIGPLLKIHSETRAIGGAGGIKVPDEEWEETFIDLAERARAVIVRPGASKGIFIELTTLKDTALLGKCVFIVPGLVRDEATRKRAKRGLEDVGLVLPENDGASWSVFRVGADALGVREARIAKLDKLDRAVADLLSDIVAEWSPVGSWRRNMLVRRWHRLSGPVTLLLFVLVIWWLTSSAWLSRVIATQ